MIFRKDIGAEQLKKTEAIRKTMRASLGLDPTDRRILSILTEDATQSYATVGTEVGLSAPAVHERVKRLRASGAIKATVAHVDGAQVGKPILAFIHVDTIGWGKTREVSGLAEFPEVEEIHSATGDTCLIVKVRVASPHALEGLLAKIYDLDGVRGTRTYMTLSTILERSPQAGITEDLESVDYFR